MMSDPPRRRLPRWVSTLVVVGLAVVFLIPGPWRGLESAGSIVLAPIQMGVSGTLEEAANIVPTARRESDLAEQNADVADEVAQLRSELAKMHEQEVGNQDLRNLHGMK